MAVTDLHPGQGSWLKWLSLVVRIAVAVLALAWVVWIQEWSQLKAVFAELRAGPFLITLAVFALSQVLLATRWWILLRSQSITIPLRAAIRLHYIGLFYNNLMPSSVGGDFLRAWYVSKHTNKRIEAALSVFVDRGLGLFGLLLMAFFAYFFLLPEAPIAQEGAGSADPSLMAVVMRIAIWVMVGAGGALVVLGIYPPTRRRLLSRVRLLVERLQQAVGKVKQALLLYCRKPFSLIIALSLTVCLQSMVIGIFWYLGRYLGMEADLRIYFVVFPVTWVLGTLPVSIAGIGILESGVVVSFVYLAQVSSEQAIALAFCQRIIWVLNSLPGAALHMLGAHQPESISFDEDESER